MMRMERVHGYLQKDGVRIAIRSKLTADYLAEQDRKIAELNASLIHEKAECSRLRTELDQLRKKRWVRLGAWFARGR
jgi:predicted RNase H-like nuclease (RuvC/YqgF family)